MKFRLGKWPGADAILADLGSALVAHRLTPLPSPSPTPAAPASSRASTATPSTACWPPRRRSKAWRWRRPSGVRRAGGGGGVVKDERFA